MPTTDPSAIVAALRATGFTDGDWRAYLGGDKPVSGCTYLVRPFHDEWQHVWVCTHDGRLTWLVFHVYVAPYNGRAKGSRLQLEERGAAPIYANGCVALENLLPWLGQQYKAAWVARRAKGA